MISRIRASPGPAQELSSCATPLPGPCTPSTVPRFFKTRLPVVSRLLATAAPKVRAAYAQATAVTLMLQHITWHSEHYTQQTASGALSKVLGAPVAVTSRGHTINSLTLAPAIIPERA